MNYSDMSDFEINKLVMEAQGIKVSKYKDGRATHGDGVVGMEFGTVFNYCNNPSDAWPIIVENKIQINWNEYDDWFASEYFNEWLHRTVVYETTPLRAAMIVFLMMKDAENETNTGQ